MGQPRDGRQFIYECCMGQVGNVRKASSVTNYRCTKILRNRRVPFHSIHIPRLAPKMRGVGSWLCDLPFSINSLLHITVYGVQFTTNPSLQSKQSVVICVVKSMRSRQRLDPFMRVRSHGEPIQNGPWLDYGFETSLSDLREPCSSSGTCRRSQPITPRTSLLP